MKFDTGEFYSNLSIYFNFHYDRTTITGTLREDLHAFSHVGNFPAVHKGKRQTHWNCYAVCTSPNLNEV
jgi:hypothetical protein